MKKTLLLSACTLALSGFDGFGGGCQSRLQGDYGNTPATLNKTSPATRTP